MIRSFRNGDVPALTQVWVEHWSRLGVLPEVNLAMIEQAVLSRTFFDPSDLWVAETDEGIVAWSHAMVAPPTAGHDRDLATICAFCVSPRTDASLRMQLLASTLQRLSANGVDEIQVGVVRDDRFGYAGLDPIGHGVGVVAIDGEIAELLKTAGFAPTSGTLRMVVETEAYRPPVSREMLMFRRSTTTSRETAVEESHRRASAMSHLDVERHHLLDNSGNSLASVELWSSDPEARVMRGQNAMLSLTDSQRQRLDPAEAFLIATLLQSAPETNVMSVESVIDAGDAELKGQLETLRFRARDQGHVWCKRS